MTADSDSHVFIRIHLDAPNVTKINDKVVLMDLGSAVDVVMMIAHALDKPGMGVMMKKEGEE